MSRERLQFALLRELPTGCAAVLLTSQGLLQPSRGEAGALPAYADSSPYLESSEEHLQVVVLPVSDSMAPVGQYLNKHGSNRSVDHSPDGLMLGLVLC